MSNHLISIAGYEAAIALVDAVESGLPYNFKWGDGNAFQAIVRNVTPQGGGTVALQLELVVD